MTPTQESTLPELLHARSLDSSAFVGFLDNDGGLQKSISYAELYDIAREEARRLLSVGLRPGKDIVVTSFPDHETHIRLFWACCLLGIPVCPIPPLHPDPSRQKLFFDHLHALFGGPTFISTPQTIAAVAAIAPGFTMVSVAELVSTRLEARFDDYIYPGCNPLPDDIVCLMLTSGSTGNSKAVALRHSNLLSSIRGKIKHHETTSESRFLNWIAFDHVASVSEIHLHALEANACQYHALPSSVVAKPRNLLKWYHQYRISYTFSPNFLLAQIYREVRASPYEWQLDLSNMRALITGGEAVPVKTAVELSDIIGSYGAPRNTLRAGFGMTETGAGCIYDTKPIIQDPITSPAKYLSLGQACGGVSVRIVDPSRGTVCKPLQPGHLQISGPSVFTGYYNNPKATADSFTPDGWFVTGDTAQFDQEGNLHLLGRDKDCLNVNGVKHPSVDVETYIEDASIQGATKAYVYVCPVRLPGADTETYAVFYQHSSRVEDDLDAQELLSITDEPRHPERLYCVLLFGTTRCPSPPTQIFYQICDRQGLPHRTRQCNAVEEVVFDAVTTIFNLQSVPLNRSQNVFELGPSSMHLMHLKQTSQDRLSIADIPTINMLKHPELGSLCDYLSSVVKPKAEPGSLAKALTPHYNPLVCLNPRGSKPPLFLVHPGVGEILVFINLARVLADDRPVHALRARGFDGEDTFGSFREIVDTYVPVIEASYPKGPYYIGGYSFGGALAFEIAKRLESEGRHVAWVGVFNLPPHIQSRMRELVWIETVLNLFMFLALIKPSEFETIKQELFVTYPEAKIDRQPSDAQRLMEWLLGRSDPKRYEELQLKVADYLNWTRVAYDMTCLGRSFEPEGSVKNGLMKIYCAIPLPSMGTREEFKRNRLAVWKDFAAKVELVDVDGEHYTMISKTHVESFAQKLRGSLRRAEEFSQGIVKARSTTSRPRRGTFSLLAP